MTAKIVNKIKFPEFSGIKCSMMPFVQGDKSSLPEIYKPYSSIIEENYLEKGEVGFLTIQESYVESGKSQRGFGKIERNVHVEVGKRFPLGCRWGSGWGGNNRAILNDKTMVLIANSVSDTCRFWDTKEMSPTNDGDLSDYIEKYPEESGILMKSGELAKMSIFTPHECVKQKESSHRQFIRIVGKGVHGREEYFTINPLVKLAA